MRWECRTHGCSNYGPHTAPGAARESAFTITRDGQFVTCARCGMIAAEVVDEPSPWVQAVGLAFVGAVFGGVLGGTVGIWQSACGAIIGGCAVAAVWIESTRPSRR